MSKRMQNLILEILQAQPSLRDSKSYLNSFAPRKPPPRTSTPASSPSSHTAIASSCSTTHSPHHLEFAIPPNVSHPASHHNPSTTMCDPKHSIPLERDAHATPPAAAAHAELPKPMRDVLHQHEQRTAHAIAPQHSSTLAIPHVTPVSDALADEHTALVKVQGPFTDRQLDSIAEGLVYLKRLGLVSVVVVDHEDWADISTHIDHHGHPVVATDQLEQPRLAHSLAASQRCSSSMLGRKQERLRKRIMADTLRLADSLNRNGAMARPFPHPILILDAPAAARVEAEARHHQSSHVSRAGAGAGAGASCSASSTRHCGSGGEQRPGPALVSDDGLASIRSALASDHIPVLAPYALYEDQPNATLQTLCMRADDVMVALARDMVVAANRSQPHPADDATADDAAADDVAADEAAASTSSAHPLSELTQAHVDMMPLRLMVINREGGIPSHARGGDPHLSINLASEYHQIKQSFVWHHTHPTALRNLDTISDCLSYMPHTSSGVLVTHRSPRSLIANLITNKAAHSPSLPHRLLANKKDVRHTPTIIRPGLPIKVIQHWNNVDVHKLTALLEAAFRRTLQRDAYFERLTKQLDFVIVTGDYQGAAIVTNEYAPDDDRDVVEPIAYLDKFAVLPSLQGSGTVDFLWGALRDEVQGLGLLDALNDNGGRGGYGTGRDLVWKSRSNNPVNRWYYERSNGFVRIHTDANATGWQLFWCDAEDKLARLSGERRLSASASNLHDAAAMAHDHMQLRHDMQLHHDMQLRHAHPPPPLRSACEASGIEAYERSRRLSKPQLESHLHRSGGTQADLTLLPIVAPEERGRLLRWAKCINTIQGVWAD